MNIVVREVRSLGATLADAARYEYRTCRRRSPHRLRNPRAELFWDVLTAKRWEFLKVLCGAGPVSVREAARRVYRYVKAVHGDVTALLNAGVLTRAAEGRIAFPYDAVKVEFVRRAA